MNPTINQEALSQLLYDRFDVFMEEIFGFKNEPFHNEMDAIISNPAYQKIALAEPRGTGKTNHLSIGYPLWEIAKNHNITILLISNTATTASRFLSQIINIIEKNEKYRTWNRMIDPKHIGVVPKISTVKKMEEKWSGNAITIDRDDLNIKEPTITAVGLFGPILSMHVDIVILDDVVDEKNSQTAEQREKIKEWVYNTVMPARKPNGRFIALGNTWHADDLMSKFLNDPSFDFRDRKKSIIHDSNHPELWQQWYNILMDDSMPIEERKKKAQQFYQDNQALMDDGVEVLWPSMFPYSLLYIERTLDPYSFARMRQCDPSERPDQKFKEEWLQLATQKGKNLRLQRSPRMQFTYTTTIGLDLAISPKESADDTAFLILDQVNNSWEDIQAGDYVIRDIIRGKFTPNQVKDYTRQFYYEIKPAGIRVENVGYQDSIRQELAEEGLIVRGFKTGANKNDPVLGFYSLALIMESGKLVIPFDTTDARTIEECSKLLNGLRAYPSGHTDDAAMALWFAVAEMKDVKGFGFSTPPTETQFIQSIVQDKSQSEIDRLLDLEVIRKHEAESGGRPFNTEEIYQDTNPNPENNIPRQYTF
jgi:hypothetical protein